MLYHVVLVSATHQHETSHRDTYVPSLVNLPPPPTPSHLSRLSESTQSHRVCKFPLAIYLHMVMYMFPCCSLHPSHSLLLPLCPQVSSLCLPLLLPCKKVHQYHFSRFHIYMLIHNICFFSLSNSTLYNTLQVHPQH